MSPDIFVAEEFTHEEKRMGTKQAFTRLIPFLMEHKRRLIIRLVLLAVATGLSVSWPLLLQKALGEPLDSGNTNMLITYAVAIAVMQMVALVLQYIMRVKLIPKPFSYFCKQDSFYTFLMLLFQKRKVSL